MSFHEDVKQSPEVLLERSFESRDVARAVGLLQRSQLREVDLESSIEEKVFHFDFNIADFSKVASKVQTTVYSDIWHIGPSRPHLQGAVGFFQDRSMFLGLRFSRCRCGDEVSAARGTRVVHVLVRAVSLQKNGKIRKHLELGENDIEVHGDEDDWSSSLVCLAQSDDVMRKKLISKNKLTLRFTINEVKKLENPNEYFSMS